MIEEIADVTIMLWQMEYLLKISGDKIEDIICGKIERQLERMDQSEKTHSKTRPAKPHGRVGSKETRPESPGTIPPAGLPSGADGPGAGETDRKKDGSRIPERKVWEKA